MSDKPGSGAKEAAAALLAGVGGKKKSNAPIPIGKPKGSADMSLETPQNTPMTPGGGGFGSGFVPGKDKSAGLFDFSGTAASPAAGASAAATTSPLASAASPSTDAGAAAPFSFSFSPSQVAKDAAEEAAAEAKQSPAPKGPFNMGGLVQAMGGMPDDDEDDDGEMPAGMDQMMGMLMGAMESGDMSGLPPELAALVSSATAASKNFVAALPVAARKRVAALEHLHGKRQELLGEMQKEIAAIEAKYATKMDPIYNRRAELVSGASVPTEAELEEYEELGDEESTNPDEGKEEDGISGFWVNALSNHEEVGAGIEAHDHEALKHLNDIRVAKDDGSFTITFVFSPNDYFSNSELTKKYITFADPSTGDLVLSKIEGCTIDWKADKDLTVAKVEKTQRNKKTKAMRTIVSTEPRESFFTYFNTPPAPEDVEGEDELDDALQEDYELGVAFRDTIVPNAIKFFTGDAVRYDPGAMLDSDVDDDDYSEDDDDDDDDDDSSDDEGAPRARRPPRRRGGRAGRGGAGRGGPPGASPECKQQ